MATFYPISAHAERFLSIEWNLCHGLQLLDIKMKQNGVFAIYNPLLYASEPHANFVRLYCNTPKKILFLGMNPGPFGMCQTGVPFGDVAMVNDLLLVNGVVNKPVYEHPNRPVEGFECNRREVSGLRLWSGLINGNLGLSLDNCLVYNFCPLAFMKANGTNIPLAKLRASEKNPVNEVCRSALIEVIKHFNIQVIVGIGRYAENQAIRALKKACITSIKVYYLGHPSPIHIRNNEAWFNAARNSLQSLPNF